MEVKASVRVALINSAWKVITIHMKYGGNRLVTKVGDKSWYLL